MVLILYFLALHLQVAAAAVASQRDYQVVQAVAHQEVTQVERQLQVKVLLEAVLMMVNLAEKDLVEVAQAPLVEMQILAAVVLLVVMVVQV
jgi:hypothetical protein